MTTPGRRGGAGASARQVAEAARTAERTAQHRRAKVTLPLTAACAVVVGVAAAVATVWQLGLLAAFTVAAYGILQTYRRADNSWAKGAAGEVATARLLAPLARRGYAVLHDRAIPGSRANLDHLVVGPAGVAYVDTKAWRSTRSKIRVEGGTLRYGRYDQTRALQTVCWEAGQAARQLGVEVRPIVAVHGATVPGPRGRIEVQGVMVASAKKLPKLLQNLAPQPGWSADRITAVEALAERRLPPHGS
ncbi:nuclease-related domain-containing protein [Streptomyces sp. WMMB303]|uniref:nuclease-related domain-containing protein n=1 Tax=Streptomyces sp. WMMB303 TaxID=3034154 RepID=UPI0023EAE1FB|nr:nuclease-related domain-containing protein [Streptomyces sp. WMMB303]MDF4254675.1 nuclease-related domain-containing protein [Streptomyces sp. WMMB303]